jgi:hypothetical protein
VISRHIGGRGFGPALIVSILLAACASSSGPSSSPAVKIRQLSQVETRTMTTTTGTPVVYELEISNPLDHPITLTSVEVETVGASGAYGLPRVKHTFDREIAAQGTDIVQIRAWVKVLQQDERDQTSNPVQLRGTARFRSEGAVMQTAFTGRVQ